MTPPHARSLPVRPAPSNSAPACALPIDQLEPRREALLDFAAHATAATADDTGILLRFPLDDALVTTAWSVVQAERRCCPHFRYTMRVDPSGGAFAFGIETDDPEQARWLRAAYLDAGAPEARHG